MSEHQIGIHDSLTFEQYRKAQGVSRSMLLDIHPPRKPAHYHARHIAKTVEESDTAALKMGRFVHLMLTPELLRELVVQPDTITIPLKRFEKLTSCEMEDDQEGVPEGEIRVQWNSKLNECKRWNEQQEKEVIDAQSWKDLHGMWESVRRHPLAGKLLRLSDCERSAFAQDPATGLMLKARFDGVPRGSNILWDLKSCESADEESVGKFAASYKLWYQAAFYLHVADLIGLDRCHFYFVFVEKSPPYCTAVYEVDPYHIEAGRRIIRADLSRLAHCLETNEWPGYEPEPAVIALPKWEIQSEGLEEVA